MNKEWSELNKTMQAQIKKRDTFDAGIKTLKDLRYELFDTILSFKEELSAEDFYAIPFMGFFFILKKSEPLHFLKKVL